MASHITMDGKEYPPGIIVLEEADAAAMPWAVVLDGGEPTKAEADKKNNGK